MAGPSGSDSTTNNPLLIQSLQGASQSWAAFDWNGKRDQFDSTIEATKEARDQSQTARKQLAESTKEFKKSVRSSEQSIAALSKSGGGDAAVVNTAVRSVEGLTRECKTIVKSYQEEINNLTRRCKLSEQGFGNLVQALHELPDPGAVMAACLDHMQQQQNQMTQLLRTVEDVNKELQSQEKINLQLKKDLASQGGMKSMGAAGGAGGHLGKEERDELVKLRRDVAEYEVEFRSLKNQDITIRKLEGKIAEMNAASEAQMAEQLEKAKEELAETEGRRAAEALEREAAMERKVQTLSLELKAERAGAAAAQANFLEADEGVSQREAAWEAQRRILVDDAERLRESFQTASRERDELRLKLAALQGRADSKKATSSSSAATPPPSGVSMNDLMLERKAYEAEVAELSNTATILREELRLKEETISEEKRGLQSRVDQLERERSALQASVTSLEAQVASSPSQALVESMKRELRILKRLEYNAGADDVDADRDDNPEIAGGGGGGGGDDKDLESVLVQKLRRAESDLVRERISKTDLYDEVNTLRRNLSKAEAAKEEAEKLVASLESDLDRAISSAATPTSTKVVRTSIDSSIPEENPAMLESILDPNAPPPPAHAPRPVGGSTAGSSSASATSATQEAADDDHSVATIVMAQRDRLRARCEALEAERDSFKRELQGQVEASESLKTDNTKLYEKVRYLQTYNKGLAPPSGGGGRAYARSASSAGGADRDLDLEALEQRYEASVDPFRQFSKAERQRKLNELSPIERTVYIVAKTVLATKEMRTALFFYVLVLHFLVFVTTYHWTGSETCQLVRAEHLVHLPPHLPSHFGVKDDIAGASVGAVTTAAAAVAAGAAAAPPPAAAGAAPN